MKRICLLAVVLMGALVPIRSLHAGIITPPADSMGAEWQLMPLGTIRHDKADSLYTGLAASYPSVGKITWPGFLASGTLISPTWVLTAAHVVDDAVAASSYTFDLTASGGGTYTGTSKMYHPS